MAVIVFDNSDVLLSVAEVQKCVTEVQEGEAQITALQKQVAEKKEWLSLVAKVIGPERAEQLIGDAPLLRQVETSDETTPPTVRQRPGGVTWTGFIEDYVNSANRPVNYAELREAVSNSILRSKLEKSEKSFYGAIIKLTDSGRVMKEHRWIFSVAAFDEYKRKVANGEIEPLPPSSSEQHARKPRVGDGGRRSSKTSTSYHPPKAPPNNSSGTEEETTISSESNEKRLIPPAGDDAEPRSTEVGKDQYASGGGPMTPTVYVGNESAGVPFEVPPNNSPNPPAPVEAQPKAQTPQIDFGGPLELPPPTKSLFPADTPEPSPVVKSLLEALSAAPRDLP